MGKLSPSKSDKEQSQRYKNDERWKKNREARLERHMSKFPNDKQAEKALDRGLEYRRYTPRKKQWSPQDIELAHFCRRNGVSTKFLFSDK